MKSIPPTLQSGVYYILTTNNGGVSVLGRGDEANLDPRNAITKMPAYCTCHVTSQPGATCMGLVFKPGWVVSRCACSAHNALCNRHAKKRPEPTRKFGHFITLHNRLRQQLESAYIAMYDGYSHDWLNRWSLHKRLAIEQSTESDYFQPDRVKSFIKYEVNHNEPTKARLIQGYQNMYTQSCGGPIAVALQKSIFSVFNDRQCGITFASGLNSEALGDWMTRVLRRKPVGFYERDGKNWDATMGEMHAELVDQFYEVAGPGFLDMVRKGQVVNGSVKTKAGHVKYHLDQTTKSGHNDTTLRNSIINAAIAYEAACDLGIAVDIIVAGDDLLMAVYDEFDGAEVSAIEAQFGIIPEYRCFSRWEEVSFISGVWYPTDDGIMFGPKLGRLLARLFWTCRMVKKGHEGLFKSSIVNGLVAIRDFPVFRAFYNKYNLGKVDERYLNPHAQQHATLTGVETFIQLKYGLSEHDLADLEEYIALAPRGGVYGCHYAADRIMEVDLAEIEDRPTFPYTR